MVQASYELLLDIDGDSTFTKRLPALSVECSNGMGESYETVARATQLRAVVSNANGEFTSGLFGDFTSNERTETIANEQLTNGGFEAFTASEPDSWTKHTYTAGMTTSETASGGGAGTDNLNITGTGDVSYSQLVDTQQAYEVSIVVSQFSGSGRIEVWLHDSGDFNVSTIIKQITATGTHTFRMDTNEELGYFELRVIRETGTFTVTIDSASIKQVKVKYGLYRPVEKQVLSDTIVTNGEFTAWTGDVPTGWSEYDPTSSQCGSGEDHTGAGTGSLNLYEATSGLEAGVRQTVATTKNQRYRFDIVISRMSGTGVKVKIGNGAFLTFSTVGTHTAFLTALGTLITTDLKVIATARPFEATIDSISIRAVTFVTEYVQDEEEYQIAPDTQVTNLLGVKRGTLVKFLATYDNLVDTQLWIGKLYDIKPTPEGTSTDRTVEILCKDPIEQLDETDYLPSYQEDVTVDAALTTMLREAPALTWPYARDFWILGQPGSSELGETTTLYEPPPTDFDTGITVIPFVGDNTDRATGVATHSNMEARKQGASQIAFIRDLMSAEVDGRLFWQNRTGELAFHNRHRDILGGDTPDAYFMMGDFITGDFRGADRVFNKLVVHYQPRSVGAAGAQLWSAPNLPITLPPKSTRTMTIRYQDPNNPDARVGGKNFITPRKGIDWIVNTAADGSGVASDAVNVKVVFRAGGAEITLHNRKTRQTLYVTTLKIHGTPITLYQPEQVATVSPSSFFGNDIHPMDYRAPMVSTIEDAEAVAGFLLGRYSVPVRRFASIEYLAQQSDTRMRNALTLTVGDRIRVQGVFLQHLQDYMIVGERHRYDAGSGEHRVTYIVKPASSLNYWKLGDEIHGLLSVSTYVVF